MSGAFSSGFGGGFGPLLGVGAAVIRDSLSDLRTRIRDVADSSGGFVTDAMLNTWVNQALGELYELLVRADETHFEREHQFSLVANTRDYALPADVWRIRGVDLLAPGGAGDSYYACLPVSQSERHRYSRAWNLDRRGAVRYQLRGNILRFRPTPSTGYSAVLWYIPRCPRLANDSDVPPINVLQGWLDYVVTEGAIRCRVRENLDANDLRGEKAALMMRIKNSAATRDAGDPETVGDARGIVDYDYYAGDAWY